jgi:DNA-binding response OmpR family regulator
VSWLRDGREALIALRDETADLVLLDLGLPGKDGLEVLVEARHTRVTTPVIVMTARDGLQARVHGLDAGADDYLIKPFAFPELLARVQALVRRATRAPESTRLVVDGLALDRLTRAVERDGRAIDLRPREFALLELLMRNAGRVVSKTMILSQVWGYDFDPGSNVVDVLVFRLRDKIDRGFPSPLLHTVRGIGYVIRVA